MKVGIIKPHSRDGLSTDRGLTLVEVLIATAVLVFIFISSISVIQRGFEMMDTARANSIAGQILQSEIEDIRLRSWQTMPTTGNVTLPAAFASVASRFTATREVGPARLGSGSPPADLWPGMRRITIRVQWRSYLGRQHERSYTTLYSFGGLNDYYISARQPPP